MSFKGNQCASSATPEECEMKSLRKSKASPAGALSSSPTIITRHVKVVPCGSTPLTQVPQEQVMFLLCAARCFDIFLLPSIPPPNATCTGATFFGVGLCCFSPQDAMRVFNKQKVWLSQTCCFAMLFLIVWVQAEVRVHLAFGRKQLNCNGKLVGLVFEVGINFGAVEPSR